MKIELSYLKSLLCEKVTEICENKLHYKRELKLQGLLGITLDEEEVILVSLDTLSLVPESRQLSVASNSPNNAPSVTQLHGTNITNQSENDLENNNFQYRNSADNQHLFHLLKSDMTTCPDYSLLAGISNTQIAVDVSNVESLSSVKTLLSNNLSQIKQSSIGICSEFDAIKKFSLIEQSSQLSQDIVQLSSQLLQETVQSFPTVKESSCQNGCKKNKKKNENSCRNSNNYRIPNCVGLTSCDPIVIYSENSSEGEFGESIDFDENVYKNKSIPRHVKETDAVRKTSINASQGENMLFSKVRIDLDTIIQKAINNCNEMSNTGDAVSILLMQNVSYCLYFKIF